MTYRDMMIFSVASGQTEHQFSAEHMAALVVETADAVIKRVGMNPDDEVYLNTNSDVKIHE